MSDPFIGEIRMFAGNFAPVGWAFCDGQLQSIAENSALFALIGTIYGGDGQTTFALPDLRGRVPISQGSGPGLSLRTMGESVGVESVTLLQNQMPAHSHSQVASTSPASLSSGPAGAPATPSTNLYAGGNVDAVMAPAAVSSAGGSQPHSNMAPYLALNFIIALYGIFPARN